MYKLGGEKIPFFKVIYLQHQNEAVLKKGENRHHKAINNIFISGCNDGL